MAVGAGRGAREPEHRRLPMGRAHVAPEGTGVAPGAAARDVAVKGRARNRLDIVRAVAGDAGRSAMRAGRRKAAEGGGHRGECRDLGMRAQAQFPALASVAACAVDRGEHSGVRDALDRGMTADARERGMRRMGQHRRVYPGRPAEAPGMTGETLAVRDPRRGARRHRGVQQPHRNGGRSAARRGPATAQGKQRPEQRRVPPDCSHLVGCHPVDKLQTAGRSRSIRSSAYRCSVAYVFRRAAARGRVAGRGWCSDTIPRSSFDVSGHSGAHFEYPGR